MGTNLIPKSMAAFVSLMAGLCLSGQSHAQDWSGAYAGLSLGHSTSAISAAEDGILPTYNSPSSIASSDVDGNVVSAFFGYRWQTSNLVFGVEGALGQVNADADFLGLNAIDTRTIYDAGSLVSARLSVGVPVGSALVYATGGLAQISANVGVLDENAAAPSANTMDSRTNVSLNGTVLGIGAEFMMTDSVSLGLEYLHYDFEDFTTSGAAGLGGTENWSHSLSVDTVSLRVAMRF